MRLLLLLLSLALQPTRAAQPPAASFSSSTTTTAPGGFSSKGELPQMDFARLGAQKAARPGLCARVGDKAFFLCLCRGARGPPELQGLRDDDIGGGGGGSGLHVLAPGLGCLCQGHDGDVLAQVCFVVVVFGVVWCRRMTMMIGGIGVGRRWGCRRRALPPQPPVYPSTTPREITTFFTGVGPPARGRTVPGDVRVSH